jgi:hypothetical protein
LRSSVGSSGHTNLTLFLMVVTKCFWKLCKGDLLILCESEDSSDMKLLYSYASLGFSSDSYISFSNGGGGYSSMITVFSGF